MKNRIIAIALISFMMSCQSKVVDVSSVSSVNWDKRKVAYELSDSLEKGTTYLSIYAQIYSQSEHRKHNLTATVSLRNINQNDTVFVNKAYFYNTTGTLIRSYFKKPIFIAPMETVEIIIDEVDAEGGTGANFLFDWSIKPGSNEPYFEGVMISTSGQQGLSFTTKGVKLK